MRKPTGFTLIELMVVVAIIAILSAVAYPLYTNQVLKSRRTEARVALNEISLAQERYFTVNGSYGTAAQLGAAYADALGKMTDRTGDGLPDYYTIVMTPVAPSNTFNLTATAAGTQADDTDCASFSLNELGARTATTGGGDPTERCW